MTQQRQNNKMVGTNKFGDTTWTKIFVGGLAWETHSDTMNLYFQQFGEILEAVVIADKITGKSKGYGFVTFKSPDSAAKACQDPYPVIDGRRANCNLASLGATHKNRPTPSHPPQQGMEQFRPSHVPRSAVHGGSMYYHQPVPQNAFPYSAYGYPSYAQDMYSMNYYNNAYGGQHYPFYYAPGLYYGYRPSYGQSSPRQHQHQNQHPKLAQHPYLTYQYHASPTLASPPLLAGATTDESGTASMAAAETASEQK